MPTDRNITPLRHDENDQARECCAKLPVHDPLVRLLSAYDQQRMEVDVFRRLAVDYRAEILQLRAELDAAKR